LLCLESSLPLISFSHSDMTITTSEINLEENFGSMELIQYIIKPRDGAPILDCNVIDGSTVNIYSPTAIFLWHQEGGK